MQTDVAQGTGPSTGVVRAWMSAVAEIVRPMNGARPLDMMPDRIAEQACRLIGFDFCAVMPADPTDRWLLARGSHGLGADYVQGRETS